MSELTPEEYKQGIKTLKMMMWIGGGLLICFAIVRFSYLHRKACTHNEYRSSVFTKVTQHIKTNLYDYLEDRELIFLMLYHRKYHIIAGGCSYIPAHEQARSQWYNPLEKEKQNNEYCQIESTDIDKERAAFSQAALSWAAQLSSNDECRSIAQQTLSKIEEPIDNFYASALKEHNFNLKPKYEIFAYQYFAINKPPVKDKLPKDLEDFFFNDSDERFFNMNIKIGRMNSTEGKFSYLNKTHQNCKADMTLFKKPISMFFRTDYTEVSGGSRSPTLIYFLIKTQSYRFHDKKRTQDEMTDAVLSSCHVVDNRQLRTPHA